MNKIFLERLFVLISSVYIHSTIMVCLVLYVYDFIDFIENIFSVGIVDNVVSLHEA